MKSIILASGMTLVLVAAATLLLRYWPSRHRARQLTLAYLTALVALVGVWWATPADLRVLPPSLITQPAWLDLCAALFYFTAAFFGGLLQLYNLADRGLSLRMVIDIAESRGTLANAGGVVHGYSRGRGLPWMYRKRLEDMREHGLVVLHENNVSLTVRGRQMAVLILGVRRFLGLGSQA